MSQQGAFGGAGPQGLGALIGGAIGAVAGTYIGSPQLGFLAGSMIGAAIQGTPKPKDTKEVHEQEAILDLKVQSQAYGRTLTTLYGRRRMAGNIIWTTDKVEHISETEETSGGGGGGKGGGGGNPTTTTVNIFRTYTVSFALGLTEGPISEVSRLWFDATLVYDKSQAQNLVNLELGVAGPDTKGVAAPDQIQRAILFTGTDAQEPSAFIETFEGPGNVPAFRDTAYILFENLDLGSLGRVPNITAEVSTTSLPIGQPVDAEFIIDTADFQSVQNSLWVTFSSSAFTDGRGPAQLVGFTPDGLAVAGAWEFGDNVVATTSLLLSRGALDAGERTAIIGASQGDFTVNGVLIADGEPAFPGVQTSVETTTLNFNVPNEIERAAGGDWVALGWIVGDSIQITGTSNNDNFYEVLGVTTEVLTVSIGVIDEQGVSTTVGHFEDRATGNILPAGATIAIIGDIAVANGGIFVSVVDNDSLTQIETEDGTRVADIATDAGPGKLFVDSTFNLWVANSAGVSPAGTVQLFDPSLVATSGTGGDDPRRFTESIDAGLTKFVYVTLAGIDSVRKLTLTNTVDATITVGLAAGALPVDIVTASDDFVWCANTGELTVSRINPDTDAVQNFVLPVSPTTLCPTGAGKMMVFSEVTNIVYLVDIDGTILNQSIIISDDAFLAIPLPTNIDVCFFIAGLSSQVWRVSNPDSVSGFTAMDSDSIGDANGIGCVVYDLCIKSGINPSFIDVSGLDNTPVNMLINNNTAARNPLQGLIDAYAITAIEDAGVLRWYYRGGTAVADIPESSLNAGSDNVEPQGLAITRIQAIDFPTQVTVTYDAPGRNFQQATQGIRMTTHPTQNNHLKINLPLALTDQQARNIAEVHLYESHINNQHFEFFLPPRWLALNPLDVIEIDARGINYTVRLLELSLGNSFVTESKAVSHRSYIYEDFQGIPGESPDGDTTIPELVSSLTLIVDSPPLSQTDLGLRFHDAIHQSLPGAWVGANVFRSRDAGATFLQIDQTTFSTTIGDIPVATPPPPALDGGDLSDGDHYFWDDVTTITVTLRFGDLVSSTDLGVLNGANRAILGRVDGDDVFRGELISFVNATFIGGRTYDLTRLLRGRAGTEDQTDEHVTDEVFVLVNGRLLDRAITYPVSDLGVERQYKVTDTEVDLANAVFIPSVLDGRSMRPWAPVTLPAVLGPTPADSWFINWTERPRLINGLVDFVGVTRDPDLQGWKIIIYEDAAATIPLREFNTGILTASPEDTHTIEYTVAQQIVDFGFGPVPGFFFGVQAVASTRVGLEVLGVA